MKTTFTLATFCLLAVQVSSPGATEAYLVEDGQPRAEIVISAQPPRSTQLAAQELQTYVEKISGAKLNIVNRPSHSVPVQVFVGRSSYTDQLAVTDTDLEFGAYRIVSGDRWLVLIGDDTNFVPIEPWPRGHSDIRSGRMQNAWNKITGKHWGYMHSQLHKHYSGRNSLFGTPDEQKVDQDGNVNVWTYDERGSFNAVCGFLRDLGVRWYMPGDLGEIVPSLDTIPLPRSSSGTHKTSVGKSEYLYDKVTRPDFPMRILNFRAGIYGRDAMLWSFRLGVRQPYGRQAAHGLDRMTQNEHTLTNHPDWFALYGGKRQNQLGRRLNQLCYSNKELFREAVQFARAQFDHYDMDVVSIMPPDGYTAICQCQLCEGKESPQLGYRGTLSNYVWDFVNRVAKEVGKTHPDKRISNCAYGVYTAPPSNIDKLEPNVQVIIVGGRRPAQADRDELRRLRDAWTKKTDNPIEVFENYPFTGRGFYLPAYFSRVLGDSINATKGISRGEDIWLTMDFGENAIGYNHFLIYFTARMYWGGPQQNAAAMFDEYVERFYGPAAKEMRAFFDYCQQHWREMETDGAKASQALELFATAKQHVPHDSVYQARLRLIDNYLNGLRRKSVLLAQRRGPVPKLRLVGGEPLAPIVVDGKLEDKAWREIATASTGRLRELQTGRQPTFGTSFKTTWQRGSLYFAIRCEESVGPATGLSPQAASRPPLNIATTKNGDPAIWYGDVIEILLNTDAHNYYQIAVNPAGAHIDLDRAAARTHWYRWSSQAEIATQRADDHWTVEIRIPVTQDENDPLHQVIGRKPTQSLPWHINVCRQRIRDDGTELSAFSPTGAKGFHHPMKFAHFYKGRSHQFAFDESVSDYVLASRRAEQLMRERDFARAIDGYVMLAGRQGVTDLQESIALQQAALCARSLRKFERADELADKIALPSVAQTVRLENLLAQRQQASLIEQFDEVDFAKWPFWQRGAGAFARARAYVFLKDGARAEADLQTALAFTVDPRIRTSIIATMGINRENNLRDDQAALLAYREVYDGKKSIGAADEFRCLQNATRILIRQQKYDEALAALDVVDFENQTGYWRNAMLLSLGETLAASGRREEARKAYLKVVDDSSASKSHQATASKAVKTLKSERE